MNLLTSGVGSRKIGAMETAQGENQGWSEKTNIAFIGATHTLVAFRRGLYLMARLSGTESVRIYALERIQKTQWVKGSKFLYPRDFSPDTYFKDALFIRPGKPRKVVLVFTPSTEPFIRIRRFHGSQKTKRKRDGSIEVTLSVPIEDELLYWVLSFGANVFVKEPKELRQKVVDEMKNILGQYAGD